MAPDNLEVSNAREAAEALAIPPTDTHNRNGEAEAATHNGNGEAEAATHNGNGEARTEVMATAPVSAGPADGAADVPHLATDIELIGEFEDSGFKEAPFIARRSDGQVVQMPELLFRLSEQIDGQSDVERIAERFSHTIKRDVRANDAQMLIDEQLRPLGIVAPSQGSPAVELNKVDPLLALKLRTAVVPDRAVRSLTTVFRPLFAGTIVVLVIAAMLGLDGWLFFVHGITQSLRNTLYQPALMLMLIGGVILATAFHEIGHASACRYGGAKPGVMGVGIYIVWPAFYTDITDAYRLDKRGRLRTDLGGMYFNAVFALLVAGVYALTSFTPLLLLIVLQNFAIIQQALPLLRLDGYYILSDLTGVPDIFQRIRPVLTSFIPGRPADERVTALKSWVRIVVSTYVVLIVAFLLLTVLTLVINLPRIVATGYDSAALHYDAAGPAFSHGRTLSGTLDLIQTLFLILPGAGLAYTAVRVIRRTGTGAYRWSAGHSSRQVALGLTGAAAVALAAFSWWPNGDYRPLQPGERGTLTGLAQQLAALPSGRPSLTVQRQQQLGGAPSESHRASHPVAPTSPGTHGHRSRATPANPVGAVSTAGATATTRSTPSSTPFGATTPARTTPSGAATTSTASPSSPAVPGPQSTTSPQSTSSTPTTSASTTSASTTPGAPPAGAQTATTTSTPTP
ncbi:MAG: hypothetical protein ACRDNK_20580 [Solirubrobacteraceae bacterium]